MDSIIQMEMDQIPVEMIDEILVRLPVKTLLRFKCVCRQWYRVIERRIEMIEEVLVRLPVKTLLRFKCVCKHWHFLIESRRLVDRHYSHDSNRDRLVFRRLPYNFEEEKFEEQFEEANGDVLNLSMRLEDPHVDCRIGPVNGVFCEVSARAATIDLLNPATREVKRLPPLPPHPRPRQLTELKYGHLRFGFGLDPSTGDYKTVAFYGAEFACVYSVSSECWRVIEGVDPSLLSSLGNLLVEASWEYLCGGFCNGVYYWICEGILAFDIITEKFREIEPPPGIVGQDIYFGGVGVYGGSTALFLSRAFPFSDVWVLGNGGWWSMILSFPTATVPASIPFLAGSTWIPVCVWKNEMVFDNSYYHDGPNLIRVDICTHKVTPLRLARGRPEGLRSAFSYKETLLSFQPKRERKRKQPSDVNRANSSGI